MFGLGFQKCNKVQIQVDTQDDLFFINAEMVEKMIFSKEDSLIGKAHEDINIYFICILICSYEHLVLIAKMNCNN